VLDRIEVNVIDVALEIPVVADGVLPEATLPKRVFSIRVAMGTPARAAAVVNRRLIRLNRFEKSASSAGNVMTMWR
jgi:hypothetical protein